MGYFRLFRRIKIAPGVTINVSKSGLSTSFGPRGAKITVGKRGIRKTVGIPGTGLYYTSLSSPGQKVATPVAPGVFPSRGSAAKTGWSTRSWVGVAIVVIVLAAAVGSSLGGAPANPAATPPPAALGPAVQATAFGSTPSPALTLSLDSPSPTGPAVTKKPAATPRPTTLAVKVTARTASVSRNSTASVSIKTSANARCSIVVEYKSGPSTAAGLGDKTASSAGTITWSWKVGGNTTRGTWPIYISCQLGSRSGSVATSFTVA